jgi:hypothetical protein
MTDPFALAGGAPAPKPRGRPKGSRNKRAGDLVGFLDAKCGGTAALQLAQGCMVTVAEVRAAGSLQAAELAKAGRLVDAFEAEAARLDQDLRSIVRQELAELVRRADGAKPDKVLQLVAQAVDRMQDGRRLGLADALDRMGEDRRALLPYTDQRQAQRVEIKDDRAPPVMVLVGGSPNAGNPVQLQGPVVDVPFEVLQPKSHDAEEA